MQYKFEYLFRRAGTDISLTVVRIAEELLRHEDVALARVDELRQILIGYVYL